MILICCRRISVRPQKNHEKHECFVYILPHMCVIASQSVRAGAVYATEEKHLKTFMRIKTEKISWENPWRHPWVWALTNIVEQLFMEKRNKTFRLLRTPHQARGLGWALWVGLIENWKLGGNFIDTCSEIRTIQFGSIVVGVYIARWNILEITLSVAVPNRCVQCTE